jgi:hypothetical protein
MRRLKKVMAAVLLVMVMGMGASRAMAGVGESPGHKTCGTAESPGMSVTVAGTGESPGFFDMAIIFMATLGM